MLEGVALGCSAVAVRTFAQVSVGLGGNLSRAREVIFESARRKLVLRGTLAR